MPVAPLFESELGNVGKFAGSLGPLPLVLGAVVPVFGVVDVVAEDPSPKSPACP